MREIYEFGKKIEFSLYENFMNFLVIRTQIGSYYVNDLSFTFLSFLSVRSISFPKLNIRTTPFSFFISHALKNLITASYAGAGVKFITC